MTADLKQPTVRELLVLLEKSTSLHFATNGKVEMNEEAVGGFSFRNVPTWVVMMELAKSNAVKGHWEKTGDGYLLVGTLDKPAIEARLKDLGKTPQVERSWRMEIIFGALAVCALLQGGYRWYSRRKRGQGEAAAK